MIDKLIYRMAVNANQPSEQQKPNSLKNYFLTIPPRSQLRALQVLCILVEIAGIYLNGIQ
jgi:hypothetical protein